MPRQRLKKYVLKLLQRPPGRLAAGDNNFSSLGGPTRCVLEEELDGSQISFEGEPNKGLRGLLDR